MSEPTRDSIESDSDLTDAEIRAAVGHLHDRLRDHGKLTGCTSYVQRKLGCGFNHGARILDYLVATQVITEPDKTGEQHPSHNWDRSPRPANPGASQ